MLCLRGIKYLNFFNFKCVCWDGMDFFFLKKKLLKKTIWWLGYLSLGTCWWPRMRATLHLLLCRKLCFRLMLWFSLHWMKPILSQNFNHLLSFRIALWLVSIKMMPCFMIAEVVSGEEHVFFFQELLKVLTLNFGCTR